MKNEFLPKKKEVTAASARLNKISDQLEDLNLQKTIMERLMKEGLRGPGDEFDDHLLPQLEAIKQKLYVLDTDHAIDILTFGYYIDTELQNGVGAGELTLSIADDLTDIAETVLKRDFPHIGRDAAELVVGRAVDLYSKDKKFIDVFIAAIDERRAIMKDIPRTAYVVDESTGIVEPKKD